MLVSLSHRRRTYNTMTKRKRTKGQFTKHTYTTTVKRTPLIIKCSGRVGSSCSTSDTRSVVVIQQIAFLLPTACSRVISDANLFLNQINFNQ